MLTVNLRRRPDWKKLYELQGMIVALLLGFVPAVTIAVQTFGSAALFPAAGIYGGVLLFVQRQAIEWKCPRCGKAFLRARGEGFALPFRNHCGCCGLRRGAENVAEWDGRV
jgi:ribosomal protein S27AE